MLVKGFAKVEKLIFLTFIRINNSCYRNRKPYFFLVMYLILKYNAFRWYDNKQLGFYAYFIMRYINEMLSSLSVGSDY